VEKNGRKTENSLYNILIPKNGFIGFYQVKGTFYGKQGHGQKTKTGIKEERIKKPMFNLKAE